MEEPLTSYAITIVCWPVIGFFIVEVELHFYNSISYPMLAKAICFLLLDAEIAHYADG
jgi:hypothetical protein